MWCANTANTANTGAGQTLFQCIVIVSCHASTNWTKCRGSSIPPRGPGVDRSNSDQSVWINKTIYGRVTVATPPRISVKSSSTGRPQSPTKRIYPFVVNYKSPYYIRVLGCKANGISGDDSGRISLREFLNSEPHLPMLSARGERQ